MKWINERTNDVLRFAVFTLLRTLAFTFSGRCIFILHLTSLWSEARDTDGIAFTSLIIDFCVDNIKTICVFWSYCPMRELYLYHVNWWLSWCLRKVFMTKRLFLTQKSISISPSSFLLPTPKFPMTPSTVLEPTCPFKSPITMISLSFGMMSSKSFVELVFLFLWPSLLRRVCLDEWHPVVIYVESWCNDAIAINIMDLL